MLILGGRCWLGCLLKIGRSVLSVPYINFSSWRLQAENLFASVPETPPRLFGTGTPLTCSKDLLNTVVVVLARLWLPGLGRDWLVVSVSLFRETSSRFSLMALWVCFRDKCSLQVSPSFSFPPGLLPPDLRWLFPKRFLLLRVLLLDRAGWLVPEVALE